DGIQYIDIGRLLAAGDLAAIRNGYWSPVYPALLGAAFAIARPTSYALYPVVRLVNVLLFAAAVFTFDRFLAGTPSRRTRPLGATQLVATSYGVFAVFVLHMIGVATVSPDMAVAAAAFAIGASILRRQRAERSPLDDARFGAVLAVAFYVKAVMFPAACAFL